MSGIEVSWRGLKGLSGAGGKEAAALVAEHQLFSSDRDSDLP